MKIVGMTPALFLYESIHNLSIISLFNYVFFSLYIFLSHTPTQRTYTHTLFLTYSLQYYIRSFKSTGFAQKKYI